MRLCLAIISASVFFVSTSAFAINLDWSGTYRVEGVRIKNSELESIKRNKAYINHHLVLNPKATVADGINVYAGFDIFNNPGLPNSQFGQFFGDGIGSAPSNSTDNSNVLSQNQADETLRVRELFLEYTNEFSSVLVGRAPVQFGLGLTHNAGRGLFDHWYDNRDLVAVKGVIGNMVIIPMYGKVSENELDIGDDVNDYMVQLNYDNAETETGFGLFYQIRRSGFAGNDAPAAIGTLTNGFQGQFINFYLKRGWEALNFQIEGGFAKGKTGMLDTDGVDITRDGFGVAMELSYKPKSKWSWDLKTGFAGGDDPTTKDKLEGFYFDRNYDVGLLLFNHSLGQFDVLSTSLARNSNLDLAGPNGFTNAGATPDMESLSNALYVAPGFGFQMGKLWSLDNHLIWAKLSETQAVINGTATTISSDLGVEWDIGMTFKPHDKFTWKTELGLLFPGDAFAGGTNNFATKSVYGMMTKAAVNF